MKKIINILIISLCLACGSKAYADVAVIVSANSTATASPAEISRIFLGKLKKFNNGSSVKVINAKKGSDIRTVFDKKALGKTPSQSKAYWSKLIFSGKANPPTELGSDSEIKAQVASADNVIGYIDSSAVDDTVKVISTF